jgi:hypothetical protein
VKIEELPLLRQSERAAFKRCQWRWYQAHVLKHKPIVEMFKDAADFGTLFHICMAEYYQPGIKRGPHPRETWERIAAEKVVDIKTIGKEDDIVKWEDFFTLGCELADAYVERYRGDPHWDVLDAERRFSVIIPDTRIKPLISEKGRKGFHPIVNLVGTFDLCYRDLNDGSVKMCDHKTVGKFDSLHYLTMDEQASTYITVAQTALRHQGLIGPKETVKGMEYNFIKRAALDTRPRDEEGRARNQPQKKHYIEAILEASSNYDEDDLLKMKKDELAFEADCTLGLTILGEVSADQSGENFLRYFVPRTPKERQRQIVRISEEAQVMDAIRNGKLPVLKTPTKDCQWCPYFDLCELDESGGDTEYFAENTMEEFDPYADHREGALNSKVVSHGGTS